MWLAAGRQDARPLHRGQAGVRNAAAQGSCDVHATGGSGRWRRLATDAVAVAVEAVWVLAGHSDRPKNVGAVEIGRVGRNAGLIPGLAASSASLSTEATTTTARSGAPCTALGLVRIAPAGGARPKPPLGLLGRGREAAEELLSAQRGSADLRVSVAEAGDSGEPTAAQG